MGMQGVSRRSAAALRGGDRGTPVTLGITVDPSSPEEVSVIWEPEHVSVMGTEVTVTYTDTGVPRTVTVVLQLGDRP